jgi:hypothetical protein
MNRKVLQSLIYLKKSSATIDVSQEKAAKMNFITAMAELPIRAA